MPRSLPSLKGQLLLDAGGLHGSCFHRSVVLVCEHTVEGAFGVVLNKPTKVLLDSVVDEFLPARLASELVYSGGPVAPDALCFLFGQSSPANKGVLENLALGHDFGDLVFKAAEWDASHPLRVFQGYSGWAPGQLDAEMERGAWIAHPASTDLTFFSKPTELWRHILRQRSGWQDRVLAECPDDLSRN